ncbi:MAG: hypothetical protein K2K77_06735 [Duncaniella sp.]|nr:hypothetical protein [Duncaniella sp.]
MLIAVISILLLVIGAGLTFYSATYGAVVAFLGLCAVGLIPGVELGVPVFIFWAVAIAIVVTLGFILPKAVTASRLGVTYIVMGALAGMLVGLALSHAAMIIGSVIGALLGGVAFARTPAGKALTFPSPRFWNYLCAKGLPAVISFAIIGTAIPVLVSWLTR